MSTSGLMLRTCAAELTRLRTVQSTWWFLALAVLSTVGLGTIAGLDAASEPGPNRGDPAWEASSYSALPTQLVLLGLVVTAVTSDYATGGIVPTLQWTPRRTVLFTSRAAVVAGAVTAAGSLLALGSALANYGASRGVLSLRLDEGVDALAHVAFVFGAGTALAAGLGFLLRSTAGGLVTVFLLILVLPVLLPQFGVDWITAIADRLPGTYAITLLVGGEESGIGERTAFIGLLAWAVALLLLGWARLVRDDANR